MRGKNPHDKWKLKLDLLERCVSKGYVKPDRSIEKTDLMNWFSPSDEPTVQDIISALTDEEAPLEYKSENKNELWLTNLSDAREHIEDLEENPGWYRF